MLFQLLILVALSSVWTVALWFGLQPDFSDWGLPKIAAVHLLPPLAVWIPWRAWRLHVRRRQISEAEAEAKEKQAEEERQARLAAVREQHEAEMRQRRFACDCRAIALADLVVNGRFELPAADQVKVKRIPANAVAQESDLLLALKKPVKTALEEIYLACAAAAALPIYLQGPASLGAAEVIEMVHTVHAELLDELALPLSFHRGQPPVAYFVTATSAANGAISLFEQQPDLPGAVILGFDSPLLKSPAMASPFSDGGDGKSSHGAIALLLTHPQLREQLSPLVLVGEGAKDVMTPYWDRGLQPAGNHALMSSVPASLVAEFIDLPIIGRIHHTAEVETNDFSVVGLARHLIGLLERAQINADLIDAPFSPEDPVAQEAKNEPKDEAAARCEWLIHNAGPADSSGKRLAAIGTALSQRGIEVNPVDEATNVVSHIGDLGHAQSAAMLAVAVARAQSQKGPVALIDFDGRQVAFGFVTPAPSKM